MDHVNRFESRTTFLLLRAEYAAAMVLCAALLLWNAADVDWYVAVLLFAYIDLIGYLPGAVAHRRASGGGIPKLYYVLYNTMHSFVTHAVVLGLWGAFFGLQWAMLAVPLHLCGDRAIFGNFLKSFSVPFEPAPIPAFTEFDRRAAGRDAPGRQAPEHI
ncbi:hypothetical protein [Actinosynnema pretiosum]|uniref:Integral membrane protein n=1 Tax=Actinosynnema pretiosum TaxID=42197 RepID=A0A290Z841_9PSEU|nr:hypothetical protein [Actinosynnema pretiosum]ATE55211.1 hypothetical protein CNX65_19580 [Actinosynnema pretiosum]